MKIYKQNSSGLTIIELLITLSVIAICITLMLPAIQRSRNQARANQCKNNLKQLGLALHNYHAVHSTLPPGWVSHTPLANSPSAYGWQARILPFIGHTGSDHSKTLFRALTVPVGKEAFGSSGKGNTLEKTIIPLFRCPNDTSDPLNKMRGGWAVSNYSGNFGSNPAPRLVPNGAAESWPGNLSTPLQTNGIFWWCSNVKFKHITDGTSDTIMVGERSVNSVAGIWAGVRSNSIETDQVTDCSYGNEINSNPGAFSSLHPNGSFFLMCDGAVRMIDENLDSQAITNEYPSGGIYQKLSNRNDGHPVGKF